MTQPAARLDCILAIVPPVRKRFLGVFWVLRHPKNTQNNLSEGVILSFDLAGNMFRFRAKPQQAISFTYSS